MSNTITYRDVGIILIVTPRISPDGTVLMRVQPEVSSIAPTSVNLGNGNLATAFNVQNLQTTVLAQDGETVVIGGLLSKRDEKTENKIPFFGDLPGVGSLFRFRQQTKNKTELLIVMTPHIIRCPGDAQRFVSEESERMDWIKGDLSKFHGPRPMEQSYVAPRCETPSVGILQTVPGTSIPATIDGHETLPQAKPLPYQPATVPGQQGQSPLAKPMPSAQDSQSTQSSWQTQTNPTPPTEGTKETRGWNLFRKKS